MWGELRVEPSASLSGAWQVGIRLLTTKEKARAEKVTVAGSPAVSGSESSRLRAGVSMWAFGMVASL